MKKYMRLAAVLLTTLALVSCSRDPNVVKQRYLENGNRYFDKGKYKEAAIMYRNALQKDLRFGPAYYKLALTSMKLGQAGAAVGSLRRAIELIGPDKPEHWDASVKLAEIYLLASRDKPHTQEIEPIVQQLLKRDPDSFDGHRLAGDLHYLKANFAYRTDKKEESAAYRAKRNEEGAAELDAAIAEFRLANQVKPGQPGVLMQMARSLAVREHYAEAESLFRQIIANDKASANAYTELYALLVRQKKPEEGEKLLKQAFEANPKQYVFLTILAAHYFTARRQPEMLEVLGKIKSHAKDYDQAYLAVGDFYLRVGNPSEAINQFREGINADAKKKAVYQKRIVEVLMKQGKKAEAAEINEAILKDNPQDNDARGLKASLMIEKGEVAKALPELQAVVTRAPDNPVARFNLARAHYARREFELARQQLQKAKELRPDFTPARVLLAQLLVQLGQFDPALKEAREIAAIDRNNANARLIESLALIGMRKYGDSRQLLDQLVKSNPSAPEVHLHLGAVDLAESRFKEAEESFRRAYQLNPASLRGLIGIVQTYMVQKKPDPALHLLQTEADRQPGRADLRMLYGDTAVQSGRYDVALGEYQKALGLLEKGSKPAAAIWLKMGETSRRKGDIASAVNSLQEARKILPDSAAVLSTLALTLDMAGRKQEARQVYEQTLKVDPGNGMVLNNLAFLIAESGGDLDQALTLVTRAKQLMPALYEISDTLGWIYLKKNLSDNAVQVFRDLVAKQPQNSTYRYHFAMALSQKGDKPNALKELQQALKLDPPNEEREKIQQLIQRLG